MAGHGPQRDPDSTLPQRLRRELDALQPRIDVPPELDEAILADAQAGLAARRRAMIIRRWRIGAAVAGMAAAFVVAHWPRAIDSPPPPPIALPATVPAAPHPNILDALDLARRIDRTPPAQRPLEWDINRDGAVNDADPRTIAIGIVKLDGGTR